MVVAATVLHARADNYQEQLELHGGRYPATVTSVRYDPNTPDDVLVKYVVDGVEQVSYVHTAGWHDGDGVTVLIDCEPPHTVGIQGGTQLFGGRHFAALMLSFSGGSWGYSAPG